MKWLINLERKKLEIEINNGGFQHAMYCGKRFYSDKLVLDIKARDNQRTIKDILISLAMMDASDL